MGESINYFSMAENDYQFLNYDYTHGRIGNIMCYAAQNICERYLKHLIDTYVVETDTTTALKTHSIKVLEKFMKTTLPDFICNWDIVNKVNGYYFSARYPGEDSFMVDKEDVDACWEAVEEVRKNVISYMESHKKKIDILDELKIFKTECSKE